MMLYYTTMVQAIDLYKEDKRLSTVNFAKQAPAPPAQTVTVEEARR